MQTQGSRWGRPGAQFGRESVRGELPPGYLQGGYFDAAGNLAERYVSRAEVEPLAAAMARDGLGMTQLRRFFNHARTIEARLKAKGTTWSAVLADFKKLDVAAADALAKRESKIPKLFHDFIRHNVDAVRTEEDFLRGFMPHFEALVGFGAQHLNRRDRG